MRVERAERKEEKAARSSVAVRMAVAVVSFVSFFGHNDTNCGLLGVFWQGKAVGSGI